jgi:hypothetical protein
VWWLVALGLVVALVVVVAVHDLVQRRHAILRNYPVVGHLRFILEAFGPELRQYIVTSNDEERPFSRDERRWIYTSAKGRDNTFGFGTDNTIDSTPDYLIVKHAAFPESALPGEPAGVTLDLSVPVAKVLGAAHGRAGAFRPASVVNISAMSFGSLSGAAIRALNEGAALTGCLHNTGEGGLSPFHRHGGELVLQIGTGYFGCRDADGRFSVGQLLDTIGDAPVRAIEIKLSQGAKPGLGGLLPAAKVTPEIAAMRGIPVGVDCRSPTATAPSPTWPPSSSSSRRWRVPPASPSASSRRWARSGSGGSWPPACGRPAAGRTSSPSTVVRAAPAPPRWSSPTTSPCPSCGPSRACTGPSPPRGSPTTSSSSAPAASVWAHGPRRRSRWAATR